MAQRVHSTLRAVSYCPDFCRRRLRSVRCMRWRWRLSRFRLASVAGSRSGVATVRLMVLRFFIAGRQGSTAMSPTERRAPAWPVELRAVGHDTTRLGERVPRPAILDGESRGMTGFDRSASRRPRRAPTSTRPCASVWRSGASGSTSFTGTAGDHGARPRAPRTTRNLPRCGRSDW